MFLGSVSAVILSSYLIVSALSAGKEQKGGYTKFLYFLLTAFAQIVLTFEALSLFKAVSVKGVLISNVLFLAAAVLFFRLPLRGSIRIFEPKSRYNHIMQNITSALKRDKALMFLSICFVLFIIFQLITIFFFPVTFGDAFEYYFPRCTMWIQQGSISHYYTPDARELIMPVNMEFLYTWLLLLAKSERGAAIFSFIGYTGMIYVLFNLLRELKFSIRRSLWAVFVFSSFALVTAETVTPCSNLFTGSLLAGGIYLFIKFLHGRDKTALYFSALSCALAAGVKTTALIAAPSVFLILYAACCVFNNPPASSKEKRTKSRYIFKPLIIFCGLFIINFLIFSSYNYILNFIDFSNPFTSSEQMLIHQFRGGIKGYTANVIKYFFSILDMSGMPAFIDINALIEYFQKTALSLFGTDIDAGTAEYFPKYFQYNNAVSISSSALGAMGLFVFLPSIIYSLKRAAGRKSKRAVFLSVLAFSIIFNILVLARAMVFTGWNMRHIITFTCIAAPVIAYSYPAQRHKLCKIFLCLIMFIYLAVNTYHKPFSYIFSSIRAGRLMPVKMIDEENAVFEYLKPLKIKNTALIYKQKHKPAYFIEKLRLYGVKAYKIPPDSIEQHDFSSYDCIITSEKDFLENCSLCSKPFEYAQNQGFIIDSDYKGKHYVILRKK